MEFKPHTTVVSADDREVGQIDRIVIDPNTATVTHLVIRSGLLAAKRKVVSIDSILNSDEARIVLQLTADDLNQQPDFEETEYLVPDQTELRRDVGREAGRVQPLFAWYPLYPPSPLTPYRRELPYATGTHLNIPDGTVAVKEGAAVITSDGKQTGRIDEVLTQPDGPGLTYIQIATGLLEREKKLIPVRWIDSLNEDEVHLLIGAHTIDKLPAVEDA